jgi:GTP-binding protein
LKAAATEFIRSAAGPRDFPADGAPEVALVGRSNVGKSSLINALVGRTVARTSVEPGKTRLVNVYRVRPAGAPAFYLMDLPGFGYARGGAATAREFEALTAAYFGRQRAGRYGLGTGTWGLGTGARGQPRSLEPDAQHLRGAIAGVVLAIDSRHPGLPSDMAASEWLRALNVPTVVAATKVDKLSQADRTRLLRQLEQTFGNDVLPVSAMTGEGLSQLWRLLLRWTSNPQP